MSINYSNVHRNWLASLAILLLTLVACMEKEEHPNLTITDQYKVEEIPGASGIVKHHGLYWVIGDDASVIYMLNKKFNTLRTFDIPSMKDVVSENGRVTKREKADLEAMVVVDKMEVVCFGSGSRSPQRETFIRIIGENNYRVEEYSLQKFYSAVKQLPAMQGAELNIEAAAILGQNLYLFNRQNNLMISLNYADFFAHISTGAPVPYMETRTIHTPEMEGISAGISGASFSKKLDRLFLTCSVENTSDNYNDGEILGSYLGTVLLSDLPKEGVTWYPIKTDGHPLKIESVEIQKSKNKGKDFQLVLTADNDNGESIFLKASLSIK